MQTYGNPTAWLDVIVILLALGWIPVSIIESRKKPGPQKGKLKLASSVIFASSFFLGGCDGMLTRSLAHRSSTTGVITHLVQHGGKSAHSDFVVREESGATMALRIDNDSKMLQIDELIRVEWLKL